MSDRTRTVVTVAAVLVAAAVAGVVGWLLFVRVPGDVADLLGVLLVIGLVVGAVRVAGRAVGNRFPGYDVAEVAVEGPITRDGGPGPLPTSPRGTPADDIVDQIEAADEDGAVDALLVKLNTPGGAVVPSDDIRRAAMAFDGPTLAYATDTCASGGYWIASGCDELWAREASIVGSIGVIGSRVNVSDLADRLGVSYERFAAGKYKDAGVALKEMDDDERAYLQGIIDDFYDHFVERVADGRDLAEDEIRDTEARVFVGTDAHERGLVDGLGARDDVEARMADLLDRDEVSVEEFTPQQSLAARLRGGAESVAYALGAGVAGRVVGDEEPLTLRF
ncbi:signal peptide peptidase SppA [Salinigranum salinum]|uniref:signal peptide peptidase SppA n=1 Tax=Salinigranum salinum TaxID=1364937 RepID=UPI001260E118|nr:signal peptide peptidase SppA [Salinigranum salinum]